MRTILMFQYEVMDKVTGQCPQNHNLFEAKGELKRYRIEVLPLTNLTLTARPNRLTERKRIKLAGLYTTPGTFNTGGDCRLIRRMNVDPFKGS